MPNPRTTAVVAHVHQVILVEEDAEPAALAEAHGTLPIGCWMLSLSTGT